MLLCWLASMVEGRGYKLVAGMVYDDVMFLPWHARYTQVEPLLLALTGWH